MASSSTSTSHSVNNDYVFDIFINHSGPDVKKTFATPLYNRLCEHGLKVFLNEQELRVGENLTPQIESAIRTSSVNIAIFSPNYAYSTWCLDELVLMLDCMSKYKSTIIPVFYGVKPTELRWVEGGKGVYAQALRELQEKKDVEGGPRYDSNTLKKWKKALSDVPEIIGFDGEKYNSGKTGVLQCLEAVFELCNLPFLFKDEQLLEDVVEAVLQKVKITQHASEYPTGLQEKIEDFENKMQLQQAVGKVIVTGIVGLGGVGKTTLAKEFFNIQRSKYKRLCILEDIRDKPLTTLQKHLLKDLTQNDEEIRSINEGKQKLQSYLPSSDCLIILDDVDKFEQLEALLYPAKDALKSSSLILVTSRNKDVLTSSDIPESSIYILEGLSRPHSKELFCSHAFGQHHPTAGFDIVVDKFLDSCCGLPLSIKVLGSLLRGKNDLNHWKALLRKISELLHEDIQGRLKISYDGLDEEEKKVFLDIACFFRGEDRDRVIRILNRTGWEGTLGLWKLENRCLVQVDSENRLRMHDHVRDMGRYLAENEPPDGELRLWNSSDNLFHKLSGQLPVRGISLVDGNEVEQSFENLAEPAPTHLLSNMSRLQLLKVEGYFPKCLLNVCHHLPNLVYLDWLNCPESSFPSWILTKNLRVLHIEGENFKTLWQHESQAPLQLRELWIVSPLLNVPDFIGNLQHLEIFVVSHSLHLESLPDSVGNLARLQHLDLSSCSALQTLPDSVGNLAGLQRLDLRHCSALHTLPDSVGNLAGLQRLDLHCSALQTLPDSFGNLAGLQRLDLHCSALQMLPDSVGNLACLQRLDFLGCSALQTLPDSVGNLAGLLHLRFLDCSSLQTLPESVGNLAGLQHLGFFRCHALQTLPDSVGNLTGLQHLDLGYCSALQTLPDSVGNLAGLQHLNLSDCLALQTLPDSVGNLAGLQHLDLRLCFALQTLPDSVGNIAGLQHLDLSCCYSLQTLPDSVVKIAGLQHLDLGSCSALQTLPDSVGNLARLQHLDLSLCSNLQKLPDSVGNLARLQHLDLSWFSNLQKLPDSVGKLTGLLHLDLSHCTALQTLPDSVGNLTGLQHLNLMACSALQTLPDSVGNLAGLQHLNLISCYALQTLPDSVGNLAGLQHLALSSCCALQTLPDSVGNLAGLQHLDLRNCSALQKLPDSVGNLAGLQHLDLMECSALQTLPDSVGNLAGLQHLQLSKCSALQTLPDSIGNLAGLQHLDLSSCSALQTLPDSVGNLAGLQHLDLSSCSALQTLPDSVGNLAGLQHLHLWKCSALQTLPYSVGNLAGQQRLDLRCCSSLQTLPDSIGNLASLQCLDLRHCSALQTLPDSVGNLAGLQRLDLRHCSALQTLPDSVGNLAGLPHLNLRGCSALQRLPDSVGKLRSLRSLVLSRCSALQRLPDSIGNLTSLQTLRLAHCSNLEMVPNVEHLGSLEYLNVFQCSKLQWDAGIVEQLRQRLGKGSGERWLQDSSADSRHGKGFIEEGRQEVSSYGEGFNEEIDFSEESGHLTSESSGTDSSEERRLGKGSIGERWLQDSSDDSRHGERFIEEGWQEVSSDGEGFNEERDFSEESGYLGSESSGTDSSEESEW